MKSELFTRLSDYRERVTIVTDTYANAAQYLKSSDCSGEPFERKASGILLDLGFNSVHVDEAERGFSFQRDGPLDMRYDPLEKVTAADLVNQLDSKSLAAIFVEYSGESYRTCKHIANVICQRREQRLFTRTLDLANCVNKALPKKNSGKTPCTGIFQALRIAVNDEYSHLNHFMESLPDLLDSGGVGVFLCFQSLEIRIIKKWIRQFFSTNTQPQVLDLFPLKSSSGYLHPSFSDHLRRKSAGISDLAAPFSMLSNDY